MSSIYVCAHSLKVGAEGAAAATASACAIAADDIYTEPRGITGEPRLLERNFFERAQAVPALLAAKPITEAPVLRVRAGHDQIEAVAISVFAGLGFAFNVERFQPSSHVEFSKKRPPNSRSKTTVAALIMENTGEQPSTAFRRKALRLLWIPEVEQGRTMYWRKGCSAADLPARVYVKAQLWWTRSINGGYSWGRASETALIGELYRKAGHERRLRWRPDRI